jgi:GR25 family glycosyltransferase involved in LPS biosynthesis
MEQDPSVKSLQIQRINATNGKKLEYLKDRRIATHTRLNIMRNDRRTHREIATLGAIGCSLSHIAIWKKLIASGKPYAVVMEDDARFNLHQLQAINNLVKTIPPSSQIWLLGFYRPNLIEEPLPRSKWARVFQFTASHAYILTRAAAQKLLEQATPIEMHIDHYISAMSTLYDLDMLHHENLHIEFGGVMAEERKPRAIESNTSQHRKDGCSACHVPDHLSRFYKRVGPKTRRGRIVHGLVRNKVDKKILTYKNTKAKTDLKTAE